MSGAVLPRDAAVAQRAGTRRRSKALALATLGLALAGGAAWYGDAWWSRGRFIETTDDAYVGGDITPIAPHVAGFIAQILVQDNQRVHAGQVLLRLDDRDLKAALDGAQAVLNQRVAALASLRASYVPQQAAIRQADAERDAKIAQAAFAQEDAARYQTLAVTSVGSRQNAQRTRALDQQAQAAVLAAQAGAEAARERLKVLDAQIGEAGNAVAQAEAGLRTAQLDLSYAEVRSPIDGTIGNRAAQVGAYVSKGTYLLSVVAAHGLWVDANFKEDQLGRLVPGQAATVIADIMPGHVFHGHVASIAPGTGAVFSVIPPENATGNFTKIVQRVPVRIAIDSVDDRAARLRPGLSVTAEVDTRSSDKAAK